MGTMNRYGAMAQKHWRQWLPVRYAQIPDPAAFFRDLGEQASQEIGSLEADLLAKAGPPAGFLERSGQANMIRLQAEEKILRELILLPPEVTEEDEEPLPEHWQIPSASETVANTESQD